MIIRSLLRRTGRRSLDASRTVRRGAAAVEMAFIVPVVFVVIFGIIEFGRLWLVVQTLNECARYGCRMAIAKNTGTTGNWSGDIKTEVQNRAAQLLGTSSSNITVDVYVDGSKTTDLSSAHGYQPSSSGYTAGSDIKVITTVAWSSVAWIPAQYLGGVTLTNEYRLNKE